MTILNNDCIEVMEAMVRLGIKVNCVVTDPPYDIKNTKTGNKSELSKSFQKSQDDIKDANIVSGFDYERVFDLLWELQDKHNLYFWCNKAQIPMYLDYFVNKKKCSFDIIKWVKTNPVPTFHNKYITDTEYCLYFRKGGYCMPQNFEDGSTLYQAPINLKDKKKWGHPTIKPTEIIDRLIRNSTKEGDTVFDPFMGSGTTGVSCKNHNRHFIGVELSEKFFDTSVERIGESINSKNYKEIIAA